MTNKKGKLGILVGGGPAPGLNGVIAAVTIEARRNNLDVIGIYDGYKWLTKGEKDLFKKHTRILRISDVSRIHFTGGSILRTSRTNPAKEKDGVQNALKMLDEFDIRYLVTIGGDDTAYGASQLAEASKGRIKFAHVPKTIDNDLPLPNDIPTFGFQTARDLGAVLVKNMMEDSRTTGRWYIVVAMGRHAGHLALGIAKSAGATLAVIGEEFGKTNQIKVEQVCDILETSILKRRAMGNNHGVMVIAEGVAERFSKEDLFRVSENRITKDAYGHMQLAEIELGKIIKREVESRFTKRSEKFRMVEINIGYVLRCADPIPFDQEYTRDLGYHAVNYLLNNDPDFRDNAMICVDNGKVMPLKFKDILDPKTKKTSVRYVNIESDYYKVARSYMVRLEKRDFKETEFLKKMADYAHLTSDQFIRRYEYLANKD